jgi:hypothetical protein
MRVSILVFRRKLARQEGTHAKTDLLARRTKKFLCGLLLFTFVKGISVGQSEPEDSSH